MKLAYFVVPHIGGTYSVFTQLRQGLSQFDIEVRWLGIAPEGSALPDGMQDQSAFGSMLHMSSSLDQKTRAAKLAGEIEDLGYDGIILNVLSDPMQTNIARYLPEKILRLMIVHNITPGTYAAARAIRNHVHATVAVSERCCQDLVASHGFSSQFTFPIANAIDAVRFQGQRTGKPPFGSTRALVIGRMEDASKGILWLPRIMQYLAAGIHLTIAGDGPDLQKLKARMAPHAYRVTFLGAIRQADVPALMAQHDILIMPSRYEGLPMTLIEAMAAGCVPVASNIRGVTDTIIEHESNGMLFPIGDCVAAAGLISRLHHNHALLSAFSSAAEASIASKFRTADMASRYHNVIRLMERQRPRLSPTLELSSWSMPAGLRPGLRSYLPTGVKNWLRTMRERA